ncbi:hypothetical protein EDD21DRAFT_234631 [Dissophora ornata]|nr:hypothetical protein EDD21DRAFT_234631 [Dissophora ornata]
MTELTYGVECEKGSQVLPTQCAHVASISPSTFVTSFFPFVKGSVHLLKTLGSNDVAPMALFDHDGQLFVHCLHTSADPRTFSSEATLSTSKRRHDASSLNNSQLEEFVEVIIRPNTIAPGADSFEQGGNIFTEVTPFAMNPTNATLQKDDDVDKDQSAEEELSSQSVNMALVHTTSKLDLETRWLVQWEGERMHPILVPSSYLHLLLLSECSGSYILVLMTLIFIFTIITVADS